MTLKTRIVLYFHSKSIPKVFLWPFSQTFGLTYSPLDFANLNCSSEVTLILGDQELEQTELEEKLVISDVMFHRFSIPFSAYLQKLAKYLIILSFFKSSFNYYRLIILRRSLLLTIYILSNRLSKDDLSPWIILQNSMQCPA